ncbi:energy transducer TonB [Candidatus Omnitrophota bacterium]
MPKLNIDLLNKSLQQLEVTYQKLEITSEILRKKEIARKQPVEDMNELSITKKENVIERFFQKKDFLKKTFELTKKPTPPILENKEKKVVVPELSTTIESPAYLTYYQIIRERIRDLAYLHYVRYQEGEVFLSFVLSSHGSLKDIRIFDDKSTNDAYLRDVALKSIKDATPFPSFPKELEYPELSFNVIISFEVDD